MGSPRVAHLEAFREHIERFYRDFPTGCGGSFGEILCYEIHHGDQDQFLDFDASLIKNGVARGCDFKNLAKKWEIPVAFLGELVSHHCALLEDSNDWTERPRYTALELMKLPREERRRILEQAAIEARREYKNNKALTDFEAFGNFGNADLYER